MIFFGPKTKRKKATIENKDSKDYSNLPLAKLRLDRLDTNTRVLRHFNFIKSIYVISTSYPNSHLYISIAGASLPWSTMA